MTAAATTTDRAEIEEKVRLLVAEAVGRPAGAVTLDASLIEELGADSLALLDLVFMLERAFAIQITRGEIERAARGDMSDEEFAPGGVISEPGPGPAARADARGRGAHQAGPAPGADPDVVLRANVRVDRALRSARRLPRPRRDGLGFAGARAAAAHNLGTKIRSATPGPFERRGQANFTKTDQVVTTTWQIRAHVMG